MSKFDLNAASSFLSGFLAEQERSKAEKKVNKALESGQYDVQMQLGVDGRPAYTLTTKKPVSPSDELIQRGNSAKAARELGDQELFYALRGGNPQGQFPTTGNPPPSNPNQQQVGRTVSTPNGYEYKDDLAVLYEQASEVDPFTQQPTPTAQRAKDEIERIQATKKTQAMEEVKPYTPEEIKIVSGEQLIPQIDRLIDLAKNNKVYEGFGVPFGASRISSFGEPGKWNYLKKGWTAGKGRDAGLILQDIKQLLFATGGQALTDPEIVKLAPKIEPAYKTEEQWIKDLMDVRQRIIEKSSLMRANPNDRKPQYSSASAYVREGTDPSGRRVGMKPDGTLEYIK